MSLDTYCRNISNEQEIAMDGYRTASKEELVKSVLNLVLKISHEFKSNGVELEDLIQEGNIGACLAAEKFDYKKDTKFSTYAAYYIRMRIKKYLSQNCTIVKESHSHRNILSTIRKIRKEYKQNNKTEPTVSELANVMKKSVTKIKNAIKYDVKSVISIDKKFDDTENDLESILDCGNSMTPYIELSKKDNIQRLKHLVNDLDTIDEFIITEYFFNNKTFKNIGDQLGVSCSAIKSMQNSILRKMLLSF